MKPRIYNPYQEYADNIKKRDKRKKEKATALTNKDYKIEYDHMKQQLNDCRVAYKNLVKDYAKLKKNTKS